MGNCRCCIGFSFNGDILTVETSMIIGSILENQDAEKRIAITPEIVKKYTSLGFEINLVKNYGLHLGFNDKEYSDLELNLKMKLKY